MHSNARTVGEYIAGLPEERKETISQLRSVIRAHLPDGFNEKMNYGMIGYVVPLTLYPGGYLGDKEKPLPFINIASQKHHIAIYHMGIYALPDLLSWFIRQYEKTCSRKPDMGKSCLRFKKAEQIPFELIGDLCSRISVGEWIKLYESKFKKRST